MHLDISVWGWGCSLYDIVRDLQKSMIIIYQKNQWYLPGVGTKVILFESVHVAYQIKGKEMLNMQAKCLTLCTPMT